MNHSLFFDQFQTRLKENIEETEFNIWFNEITFERVAENTLFLSLSSEFIKTTIEDRYKTLMLQIAQSIEASLTKITLELITEVDKSPNLPPVSSTNQSSNDPYRHSSSKNFNDFPINKDVLEENRFERFVITDENALAYRFIEKSMQQLGEINPLFIYGKIGTGKTHLLQSVFNSLTKDFKSLRVRYIQPDDFVGEYTRAIQLKHGADREFRLRYRSLDVLLIDDIQFFIGKTKSNQEFFHIFNHLLGPQRQMIFCSDRSPSQLGDIDERLKSRFHSSVIVEIKSPELESRLKIINFLVEESQLPISPEVCLYLAENFTGDIRHIVGSIKYLTVLHSLHKVDITIDYCQTHIEQLKVKRAVRGKYKSQDLLDMFCKKANITPEELRSAKRHSTLANYRHMAMYLLKEHTGLSLQQIGDLMGKRSAASVSQSHKKIVDQINNNPTTKNLISAVLSND